MVWEIKYASQQSKEDKTTKQLTELFRAVFIHYPHGTCKSYLNKICISQKKALRHIHRSSYNAHTNPLFPRAKY